VLVLLSEFKVKCLRTGRLRFSTKYVSPAYEFGVQQLDIVLAKSKIEAIQ